MLISKNVTWSDDESLSLWKIVSGAPETLPDVAAYLENAGPGDKPGLSGENPISFATNVEPDGSCVLLTSNEEVLNRLSKLMMLLSTRPN